jgi:hypothetical protein
MEKHITEVIQGQPYHIKLIKEQKDAYGWEITVYGTEDDADLHCPGKEVRQGQICAGSTDFRIATRYETHTGERPCYG